MANESYDAVLTLLLRTTHAFAENYSCFCSLFSDRHVVHYKVARKLPGGSALCSCVEISHDAMKDLVSSSSGVNCFVVPISWRISIFEYL